MKDEFGNYHLNKQSVLNHQQMNNYPGDGDGDGDGWSDHYWLLEEFQLEHQEAATSQMFDDGDKDMGHIGNYHMSANWAE